MLFTPAILLTALASLTLLALLADGIQRRRRRDAIRLLAASWRMNFGRADSLRLTARIARHLPVPGAAAVRLTDVIYGARPDLYRYVFTVSYTVGLAGTRHRQVRVASFTEPRDRRRTDLKATLLMANELLPILDQYRSLHVEDAAFPAAVEASDADR